jgi:hypothetical protein
VLQLNVCSKRFVEHFAGLSLSTRSIGHGLFDADDLMALGALAEEVTSAIHLVPWPKPTRVRQFWLFHALSFPQAGLLGYQKGREEISPLSSISRHLDSAGSPTAPVTSESDSWLRHSDRAKKPPLGEPRSIQSDLTLI